MTNKTFIEFFAGIGLVHLGLLPNEWRCVYANDIDSRKHEMYEDMFGASPYYHVANVWDAKEVISRINEAAVLATASFPCVDLSLAGNRRGLAGDDSGAFYGFVQIIDELSHQSKDPAMLMIENVMGFLTSRGGDDFRNACKALAERGYWLDVFALDAKNFTAQSRPRVFIVGCKEKFLPADAIVRPGEMLSRTMSDWGSVVLRQKELKPKHVYDHLMALELDTGLFCLDVGEIPRTTMNVSDVLEKESGEWWESVKIKKHLDEMSADHQKQLICLSKQAGLTAGTMYRRVRKGKSQTEIRTDGLAGCLRTPRGGSSRQMVFVAGRGEIKMRWMSAHEYASLQGVPNFPLNVPTNQALFGFGDAVCVPVISWIADNYLEPIFGAYEAVGQAIAA